MSNPRIKRQFAGAASDPSQRQITSFFPKTSTSTSNTASAKPGPLGGPTLPTHVQADLLSVGLRVRKAVPEGYKTGSAYSGFKLWSDNTTPNSATPSPRPTYTNTIRELEPFCGISKVGGLAFQPAHTRINDNDDDDNDMPGLTSSQDTVASSGSATTPPPPATPSLTLPSRKRVYSGADDDENGDEDNATRPVQHAGPFRIGGGRDAWLDDEISPRTVAPPAGLWDKARVLAVPRRPRQGRAYAAPGAGAGRKVAVAEPAEVEAVGQENVMVAVEDGNDFEEATFLDYGLRGDMDVEVE